MSIFKDCLFIYLLFFHTLCNTFIFENRSVYIIEKSIYFLLENFRDVHCKCKRDMLDFITE